MAVLKGVHDSDLLLSQRSATPGVTGIFEKLKDSNWMNLNFESILNDIVIEINDMKKHPRFARLNFGDRKYLSTFESRIREFGFNLRDRGNILNVRHHFDLICDGRGVRRMPGDEPLTGQMARRILSQGPSKGRS
jgi:hypothetical protein